MLRRWFPFVALFAASPIFAADAVDEALSPGLYEPRPAAGTMVQIKVPFLHSPEMEKRWGKPQLIVAADGSYVLTYKPKGGKAGQYFRIVGTRRPIPVITGIDGKPAHDGEATVLGKKIAYFGAGGESSAWQSWGIPLTSSDGRSASYVLIYASSKQWPGGVFPPVAW